MSGICVMFAYLMPFIIQDRLYIVEAFETALAMKYNSVWVSSTPMLWWQVRNSAWLWTLWQRARRQECKVLRRYHYPDWLSVISFPRSTRAFWMLHLNLLRNGNRCLRLLRWSGGQTLIKPSLMPSWRVLLMTCGPWPKNLLVPAGMVLICLDDFQLFHTPKYHWQRKLFAAAAIGASPLSLTSWTNCGRRGTSSKSEKSPECCDELQS